MTGRLRRPPRPPTAVDTARAFVRQHLGAGCFAPFTGQDAAAWRTFVCALELHAMADESGRHSAHAIMVAAVDAAQDTRAVLRVFVQAIPAILCWQDAILIWPRLAPSPAPEWFNTLRPERRR